MTRIRETDVSCFFECIYVLCKRTKDFLIAHFCKIDTRSVSRSWRTQTRCLQHAFHVSRTTILTNSTDIHLMYLNSHTLHRVNFQDEIFNWKMQKTKRCYTLFNFIVCLQFEVNSLLLYNTCWVWSCRKSNNNINIHTFSYQFTFLFHYLIS